MVKSARDTLARGEWPSSCGNCAELEAQGLPSQRSRPRRYGPGISNVDIRFGNSCNLRCVSCNPVSSHSLGREASEMAQSGLIPLHPVSDTPRWDWASPETLEKLQELPIQEVYLTGGEPMMVPETSQFLESLSSECHVRFNTNATLWNPQVVAQLKRFARVNMNLSIDAFGTKNNYIRWPSDWDRIAENTQRYQDFVTVGITATVSVLNAAYLEELWEWAEQLGIPIDLNPVLVPEWLKVSNAPHSLRSQFTRVDGLLAEPTQQDQCDQFRLKITQLDTHRGCRIQDYLPEVAAAYGIG